MVTLVITLALVALVLLSISLLKTYNHVPRKELKRQARNNDEFAKVLHKVTSYGISLDIFLWFVIGLTSAVLFVFLARNFPLFIALFGCMSVIWFGYAWMPHTGVTSTARRVTKTITPALAWVIDMLHPVLARIGGFIEKHRPIRVHTGLYTKEDLLDLIDTQQVQIDNRITKEELRLATQALTFGSKLVADVMTPKRVIKSVSAGDSIGPVLLGELHKTGHSRFPVHDKDSKDSIVGMLYLRSIIDVKSGGGVTSHMNKNVYYVNEQQPLGSVLHAFIKTHCHIFMVVNEFEEIVGLITLEDVIEQLVGRKIVDEFDKYDDLRAVAALEAEKLREKRDYPAKE